MSRLRGNKTSRSEITAFKECFMEKAEVKTEEMHLNLDQGPTYGALRRAIYNP
jgi:hypothetical protein